MALPGRCPQRPTPTNVDRACTGFDQRLHGALDVECSRAEAFVDVDEGAQLAHVGDAAHINVRMNGAML